MKAVVKAQMIKVQMTKAQERLVRQTLNCKDRPVQYAGGVMYEQGGGWYAIFAEPQKFDWASDIQMMKALLRKIRSILAPEIKVEQVVAYVAPEPEVVEAPKLEVEFVSPEEMAARSRLEFLAKVVNSKFHR